MCAETFDWAHHKRTQGVLKLHLVLDHDGCLPWYAVLSDGKRGDIQEGRQMTFAPGTLVVFDHGYSDCGWRLQLTRARVHFVTRLKDDANYGIVASRTVPEGSQILRGEVILLTSQQEAGPEARLRRIEVWVEEKQDTVVFVTNNLKLAAKTSACIYRDRWQIETFFKVLRQGLKLKTFVSTRPERLADSALDGPHRHAGPALPADEEHFQLEPVESGRAAAPRAFGLPRPVDVAQEPFPPFPFAFHSLFNSQPPLVAA